MGTFKINYASTLFYIISLYYVGVIGVLMRLLVFRLLRTSCSRIFCTVFLYPLYVQFDIHPTSLRYKTQSRPYNLFPHFGLCLCTCSIPGDTLSCTPIGQLVINCSGLIVCPDYAVVVSWLLSMLYMLKSIIIKHLYISASGFWINKFWVADCLQVQCRQNSNWPIGLNPATRTA